MKANKNNITAIFKTVPILLLIAFQSCATYNSKTADIEADLFSGDFNQAVTSIDQNKFLLKSRNRLLYLMEKGKIEHLLGNYESSNALFEEAYILIDDKIKTNAGQAVAAKFTNPMAEPYKGEDFEKVSIHYYKALNFFNMGMPNEALVEARRINIKLYEINENYAENKNKYSEDAFSQILQGIMYESVGDINNAFIAYRNAEVIYTRNGGNYFGVPMPQQLKDDLLRTSKAMGFTQEYEDYRKQFNVPAEPVAKKGKKGSKTPAPVNKEPEVTGEAIVFWENGLGPAKDQIVITAAGGGGIFYGSYYDEGQLEEIIIPIPPGANIGNINAIAIPKYRKRESYYSKATVTVNGQEKPFELAQDFYPIAKQCLKDRMLRETIDLVLRFATKKATSAGLGMLADNFLGDGAGDLVKLGADAAGAATEKADTRNWQSLPSAISYARLPLQEGDNSFVIKKYGPQGIDTDTIHIPYRKGLQIVNYFDLGRTQIVPNSNQQAQPAIAQGTSQYQFAPATTPAAKSIDSPATASIPFNASASTSAGTGITAKTVIDKYIAASGGEAKLKSVKTIYMRNQAVTNFNGQITKTETLSKIDADSNCSVETFAEGKLTSKVVVNNQTAYVIDANGKRTNMDTMAGSLKSSIRSMYDSYTLPLLGTGTKLEGITKINGEDCHVISFKEPVSQVKMEYFYSTKSGLATAAKTYVQVGNDVSQTTTYFSDYRDVDGIMHPFKTKTVGNNISSDISTLEIKFNKDVNQSDFQ